MKAMALRATIAMGWGLLGWGGLAIAGPVPAPLYVQVDRQARSVKAAFAATDVAAALVPVIVHQIDANPNFENARISLSFDRSQGNDIGLSADAEADYLYLPDFDQWTRVSCHLHAILRLTSNEVGTAAIEMTNPAGVARDCAADGEIAAALGDVGKESIKYVINNQLGLTPWSQSIRALADRDDVRKAASALLRAGRIPDATRIALAGCLIGATPAICVGLSLP
jgi:hypothetical protein